MGYGPEDKNIILDLKYNYGVTNYYKGNGYVQIAIGTDDVYKIAEAIKLCGGKIIREPGPLPGINTKIAVCLDLDGWKLVRPFIECMYNLKHLESDVLTATTGSVEGLIRRFQCKHTLYCTRGQC